MLLKHIAFSFGWKAQKGYPTHACQYAIVKEINFLCQASKLRQIFLLFLSVNSMIP